MAKKIGYTYNVTHQGMPLTNGFDTKAEAQRHLKQIRERAKREGRKLWGRYRVVRQKLFSNPSWRKSVKHLKKVQKRLGVATGPSRAKQEWKRKTRKPRKGNAARKRPPVAKCNPPKMRPAKAGGWIKADAVRFVKKGGRMTVLVRRKKARRKK